MYFAIPSDSVPVGSDLSERVAIAMNGIVPVPGDAYALSSTTVTETPGETKVAIIYSPLNLSVF